MGGGGHQGGAGGVRALGEPLAATEQLLQLHGRALRLVAHGTGQHFAGLGQAARACKLSSKLARQCRELDACSGWLRHVSGPRCDAFVTELAIAVEATLRGKQKEDDEREKEAVNEDKVGVNVAADKLDCEPLGKRCRHTAESGNLKEDGSEGIGGNKQGEQEELPDKLKHVQAKEVSGKGRGGSAGAGQAKAGSEQGDSDKDVRKKPGDFVKYAKLVCNSFKWYARACKVRDEAVVAAELEDYVRSWRIVRKDAPRAEAEVAAAWWLGKRTLEKQVAVHMCGDIAGSYGALDKDGRFSSWLREPRAEPAASEGSAVRAWLLSGGAAMTSEEYATLLAYVISCHPAAAGAGPKAVSQ